MSKGLSTVRTNAILFWTLLCLLVLFGAWVRAETVYSEADVTPGFSESLLCLSPVMAGWKYQPGDQMDWADPGFDDRAWKPLPVREHPPWLLPKTVQWHGIGWFRLHLRVDANLLNRPLGLVLFQFGASEIFVDGQQITSIGHVGATPEAEDPRVILADTPRIIPFVFREGTDHVIAVRYSNFQAMAHIDSAFPVWWGLVVSDLSHAVKERDNALRNKSIIQMLFCIPLAFALLHFLFFLFYRDSKGNLYYSIFALCIAVMVYLPFQMSHLVSLSAFYWFDVAFKGTLVLTVLSGMGFYYDAVFGRLPGICRVPFATGLVMLLFVWTLPKLYIYIFTLFGLLEWFRIVFTAIRQRKPGAHIIAVGITLFVVAATYQVLMEISALEQNYSFIYVYGFLGLVISMSVYLAYTFGQTNLDLAAQLVQVRQLSDRALEQEKLAREHERRAREEEVTRKLLEADNVLKATELEETRRRQEILATLEATNRELQETQSQLVQSEKMAALGNLVAGIAHEINTPVGAINSMHDTLVRAVDKLKGAMESSLPDTWNGDRALQSALRVIGDANRVIATGTERVIQIVRSLRNFARLDEAEMKRVDLREGIDNTLTLIHHDLKNRIEVVKAYADVPPIVCYPSRLNQVFLNILVNASQAIEGEGRIAIRTFSDGNRVSVAIQDTGHGIPQEDLLQIFDPGFTTKGVGVGTGLGLSICYQIVQDHGGEIRVESTVGEGTTFTIVLPADLDESA